MNDEDRFADLLDGVSPIRRGNRVRARPKPLSTRPQQREADDRAVLVEMLADSELLAAEGVETGDELLFRGEGLQDRVWRRLRRGSYRAGDELDLHGMRAVEAKTAVHDFLDSCRARGIRCVRIIHGKGNRSSARGPVLKQLVDVWLRRRADVLAFASCQPRHGGTGAVCVLLRRGQGER